MSTARTAVTLVCVLAATAAAAIGMAVAISLASWAGSSR